MRITNRRYTHSNWRIHDFRNKNCESASCSAHFSLAHLWHHWTTSTCVYVQRGIKKAHFFCWKLLSPHLVVVSQSVSHPSSHMICPHFFAYYWLVIHSVAALHPPTHPLACSAHAGLSLSISPLGLCSSPHYRKGWNRAEPQAFWGHDQLRQVFVYGDDEEKKDKKDIFNLN